MPIHWETRVGQGQGRGAATSFLKARLCSKVIPVVIFLTPLSSNSEIKSFFWHGATVDLCSKVLKKSQVFLAWSDGGLV